MKKTISLILALVLVCVAAIGCSNSGNSVKETQGTESGDKKEDGKIIAISINNLDAFQTHMLESYQEQCEANGYKLIYTNASGDIQKQISDVESLIVQKPDVIGIQALDSEALGTAVDACEAAGIPVASIFYGTKSDKDVEFEAGVYERGALQAEAVNQYLNDNPDKVLKIGYVYGSMGMEAVHEIFKGFEENCLKLPENAGRVELLDSKDGNWTADKAMALTEDWIQSYPDMNCIITQNDPMAVGAVSALTSANYDMSKYVVVGGDLTLETSKLIKEGNMYASVMMNIPEIAIKVIDYLGKMAKGEDIGTAVNVNISVAITKENVEEYEKLLQ